MSTKHGLPKVIDDAVKAALPAMQAEARSLQIDFLDDPMTSEEVLQAREELGHGVGPIQLAKHVREQRRGRKKGSRNRNNGDLVAYLRQFGPDPLVSAMRILAETEEFLVERSRLVDPDKKRLSLADARSHKMRMIELLAPYFYGKKPIQLELDAKGDFNLLIPGINITEGDAAKMAEGSFVLMDAEFEEVEDEDGGEDDG